MSDSQINIIISQTNYDKKMASKKLKEWNNDMIKVIKEFLNPDFEKKEKEDQDKKNKIVSINQSIIGELRKFKDKQNNNYNSNAKYKDYLNKKDQITELNIALDKQNESEPEESEKQEEPENIFL
jgi:hypothetical protein